MTEKQAWQLGTELATARINHDAVAVRRIHGQFKRGAGRNPTLRETFNAGQEHVELEVGRTEDTRE